MKIPRLFFLKRQRCRGAENEDKGGNMRRAHANDKRFERKRRERINCNTKNERKR